MDLGESKGGNPGGVEGRGTVVSREHMTDKSIFNFKKGESELNTNFVFSLLTVSVMGPASSHPHSQDFLPPQSLPSD